ncbi:RNA repair transcriptional activator RtcR [bacterium]|nr:RNA repair transcriptional activator RtcR [bacterium]
MNKKRQVIIGLLGTTLDARKGAERWEKWRPSVAICQHEDFLVSRLELLYQKKFSSLVELVSEDLRLVSPETEVRTWNVEMQDPWDFEVVYGALHDFARGYTFDIDREDYLVHITTGSHVAQICLFLLTESRHLPAKLLQTSPPSSHSKEMKGSYTIIDLDLSKYDRIASRKRLEIRESLSYLKSGIETKNEGFNKLIEHIERVAIHSKSPILLMGATGAGKSQLARRIYELKKHRRQISSDFVEVNCATLRGDAAMSALFGHVKGAFTGAVSDRAGLLRTADGGILFLDEIGELGLDEQAMLLRALEEKKFLPVGSDREVSSDFQLIAGTNRDLFAAVQQGRFREDLLARINLWTFHLPGLRARSEDIAPNLDYELNQFAEKNGVMVSFSKEARDKYLRFATSSEAEWRANFRDLNASITRMATLAAGGRITVENVSAEIECLKVMWKRGEEKDSLLENLIGVEKVELLDRFERAQLAEVLKCCMESRSLSEAGRRLFSVSRQSKKISNDADRLRKYLARFGITWQQLQN